MELSRGELKQMVRAVRAGASWEQVRVSIPGIPPEWLDEHFKSWVLTTAGVSPTPVVASSPPEPEPKKRKKG